MLHLRSHLLPLLRAASRPSSPLPRRLLLFSASTSPAPFSFEDYLVTTCGLAPAQALKASKKALNEASRVYKKSSKEGEIPCPRLDSASNPDAVLALLSGVGLCRQDIATVVAADPLLLGASVESVAPRLAALCDRLGFSAPQIARFLLFGSRILRSRDIADKLEFLISFYGSFDQLLAIMKMNNRILTVDLEKVIKPNIALLRQCGLSVCDIVRLSSTAAWVLGFNPKCVKAFVLRAEELGVPRSSRMFRHAVAAVACVSQEKVASKIEFFKRTLGCSKTELGIAVCKQPNLLKISKESFRRKTEFLINEIGLEPQYIMQRPTLFLYSLEKRLVPRHYVMKVLQAKGLLKNKIDFYSFASLGEEKFKSRFIDSHKDSVPGLADAYAAACAGEVPSQLPSPTLTS